MIGVFDSGLGGLTVLKEYLKELPQYKYIYLGDNARAPYGDRPHEVLKTYVGQAVDYLFAGGCRLIIIACNTASSQVLRELQEEYLRKPAVTDKKILGVIKPLAEEAVKITKTGRVGVVGTRSTVAAKSYDHEIEKLNPEIKVFSESCPLLVPLIEENWVNKPETTMILKKYLRPLKFANIDTLILGCTHYPFLHKDFQRIMGKKVRVPHAGKIICESLKDYLARHPEIESLLEKNTAVAPANSVNRSTPELSASFFTTGDPERFGEIGSRFLGYQIKEVSKVDITKHD
jgi:glutamate racemase